MALADVGPGSPQDLHMAGQESWPQRPEGERSLGCLAARRKQSRGWQTALEEEVEKETQMPPCCQNSAPDTSGVKGSLPTGMLDVIGNSVTSWIC